MHVFVEAARETLHQLWEELFYTEEQMAEFTPAFTGTHDWIWLRLTTPDIFTDATNMKSSALKVLLVLGKMLSV